MDSPNAHARMAAAILKEIEDKVSDIPIDVSIAASNFATAEALVAIALHLTQSDVRLGKE